MKLTIAELEQFKEKLTVADSPEEIAEITKGLGYELSAEEAAGFYEVLKKGEESEGKLNDDLMRDISGGKGEDIPQYEAIREYYRQKGPNPALILCIYYIPSPICYEIIQVIEKEESEKLKNSK